jgi:hypothetical protein
MGIKQQLWRIIADDVLRREGLTIQQQLEAIHPVNQSIESYREPAAKMQTIGHLAALLLLSDDCS